jgi:hypothetical protein
MVDGDIFMVVMNLVDGYDAYCEFGYRDLPSTMWSDVKLASEM